MSFILCWYVLMKSIKLHEISLPISQLFKYSLQHITAMTFVCTNAFCDTATAIVLFILVPFLLEAAAADFSMVG